METMEEMEVCSTLSFLEMNVTVFTLEVSRLLTVVVRYEKYDLYA